MGEAVVNMKCKGGITGSDMPQIGGTSPKQEAPDLIHEIAILNERLYKHEQERLNHESMISTLTERLNKLEKVYGRFAELLDMRGKA